MAVLCVLLTAACVYDYRRQKIPNYLIILMAGCGIWWRLEPDGIMGAASYGAQAFLVMLLLYPFFKIGAVGAGDVKLLGAAAGYLQFKKIMVFCILSFLAAAIISLIKMVRKKNFPERMKYLADYLKCAAKSGVWKPYLGAEQDRKAVCVCLSGPILVSVLLYVGGVY